MKIQPWPKLEERLPPLSKAEYSALQENIKEHGILDPVKVLPDGRIIDGHHRWKIDGSAPVQVIDVDEAHAFRLGLALNMDRRQLSPEQIRELREWQRREAKRLRGEGKSQKAAAELVGIGRSTLSNWESNVRSDITFPDLRVSVPELERPKIHQRIKAGESRARIAADYKITKQRVGQIVQLVEARDKIPKSAKDMPFPERKYRCIVIDPPWPMKKIEREVRQKQGSELDYPVMTLEEIAVLPVRKLASENGCHIYLWVTHKFLPKGLKLFEQWDARYQCLMTWVKPTGITPYSWMYNTEHVLFGRIGSLKLERLGLKLSFEAPVTRHSEKPDVFYERVIEASPKPRLEMFARKSREGFAVWGNEV